MADRLAKVGFVFSVLLLGFFYGYGTRGFGWFPNDVLDQAWDQAQTLPFFSTPGFLHEEVYEQTGARLVASEEMASGLTLITSAWEKDGELTPGLRLVSKDGEIVHEWQINPGQVFGDSPSRRAVANLDIQGSYLFPNGDVLVNLEYAGAVRLDACGRVKWKLVANNHHSVARDDDGTFWIPAVTTEPVSASPKYPEGHPGFDEPVYQDQLLHIAENGTVLDTINVLDVLYQNGLERHLAEERVLASQDPTHLNDIDPLPDSLADEYPQFEAGDLAVSLRHIDLIFVLDPESKRVKWTASAPWIYQHDPDWLGRGWIGVFDNRPDGTDRGTMLGGSRIIAIQPESDSTKVLFPTDQSENFYTAHRGKWQRLENGNLLLTEEEAGRVVEVDPSGKTVWEWIHAPVGDGQVPAVTKAVRVSMTRETAASWPCSHRASTSDKDQS